MNNNLQLANLMEGQQRPGVDYKRRRNEIENEIRRNKRRQLFTNRRLNHLGFQYTYQQGDEHYMRNSQIKQDEATNSFYGSHMNMPTNNLQTTNLLNAQYGNTQGQFNKGPDRPINSQVFKPITCNLSERTWCENKNQVHILDPANEEFIERLLRSKYDESHIPKALEDIQSQETLSIIFGLIVLRKMASSKYEDSLTVIYQLTNHNLLEKLASFLRYDNKQIKLQSSWIICNIFAGDYDASQKLMDYGVFQSMVELLNSQEKPLINQAIWNIGNIIPDCKNANILSLSASSIGKIIEIAQNTFSKNLFVECVWVVKNICVSLLDNKEKGMKDAIIQGICFLSRAIVVGFVNDQNYREVISFFINLEADYRNVIADTEIVEAVISKCQTNDESILKVSIFFLSKIAEGDVTYTQILLDNQILNLIHQLLLRQTLSRQTTKQALYMLSNIACSSASQVQLLINYQQLLQVCVWILKQSAYDQIRLQCCYVFSQMSYLGHPAHVIKVYRKYQLLPCIFDILSERPQYEFKQSLIHFLYLMFDTAFRVRDELGQYEQKDLLLVQENWIRILFDVEQENSGGMCDQIKKLYTCFVPEINQVIKYNLS